MIHTKLYKDDLFDIKAKEPYNVTITSDKYIPNTDLKRGQADLFVAEGAIKDLVKHKKHGNSDRKKNTMLILNCVKISIKFTLMM